MLEISSEASQAIRGILSSDEVTDGAAFRISARQGEGANSQHGFAIAITEEVLPEDQVVEGDDVEVRLESTAAALLDDKELDATIIGDEVRFNLSDQTG